MKEASEKGNQTSKQWAERVDQALAKAGTSGPQCNEILQAHYDVSRKICQQVPDDDARDLGIIAGGQLASHHWRAKVRPSADGAPHPVMVRVHALRGCERSSRPQTRHNHANLTVRL